MVQLSEFAFAWVLFTLSLIAFFAQIRDTRSIPKDYKGILYVLTSVVYVFSLVATYEIKGDKDWSNISQLWNRDPKITAIIEGDVPQSGNTVGCTIYRLQLFPNSMLLDKLEMKLQFPMDVYTFKVGMMPEYPDNVGLAFSEIGRSEDGECYIRQAPFVEDSAIRATQWGPGAVRIMGTNVPKGSSIVGIFIPYLKRRSFPSVSLSVDGSYEYRRSGVVKSGEMKIIDKGVINLR